MDSPTITEEWMLQILRKNNKELCQELPTKNDFQMLRNELTDLRLKYDDISAKFIELEKKNNMLEDQIDKILQKNMETNVVIHLPTEPNMDMTEKSKSVCAGLLSTSEATEVEHAHAITTRSNKTLMIVVKLKSRSAALKILKSSRVLKNSQIRIHKDLPYNVRCKKRHLFPISRFLGNKFPSFRTQLQLKDYRLFIANKLFTWDLAHGLKCGEVDPLEKMRSIFGENDIFLTMDCLMNEVQQASNVSNVKYQTSSEQTEVSCASSSRVCKGAALNSSRKCYRGEHTMRYNCLPGTE